MRPAITILMPVFNCERTVAVSIRSIINQTFTNWELLVIDDASTDRTALAVAGVRDHRIMWITDGRGNLGLASRLNQGIELARGRYIARMDGDDISFPRRLEEQFAFLQSHPSVDLVGCSMVVFENDGGIVGQQRARLDHARICGTIFRSCLLPHATWMGRTVWFKKFRYDPLILRAEDRELLLRSRAESIFAGMPDTLYAYRVNRVSIRKNCRARIEYGRALLLTAVSQAWLKRCCAALAELVKLAADLVVFVTRTSQWLYRHRAAPVADEVLVREWQTLWSELQVDGEVL